MGNPLKFYGHFQEQPVDITRGYILNDEFQAEQQLIQAFEFWSMNVNNTANGTTGLGGIPLW